MHVRENDPITHAGSKEIIETINAYRGGFRSLKCIDGLYYVCVTRINEFDHSLSCLIFETDSEGREVALLAHQADGIHSVESARAWISSKGMIVPGEYYQLISENILS